MFTIRSKFLEAELEKPVLEGGLALIDRWCFLHSPASQLFFKTMTFAL